MRGLGRLAALAALSAMSIGAALALGPESHARLNVMPSKKRMSRPTYGGRSRTTLHAKNGKRECERRMRQIDTGRLTVANGLRF